MFKNILNLKKINISNFNIKYRLPGDGSHLVPSTEEDEIQIPS